jgi:hypothetical protein
MIHGLCSIKYLIKGLPYIWNLFHEIHIALDLVFQLDLTLYIFIY